MPKFVLKDMEGLYIEEMNTAINTLKVWMHLKTISCLIGDIIMLLTKQNITIVPMI